MATSGEHTKQMGSDLDQDIAQLRERSAALKAFILGKTTSTSIEEFDLATEELIAHVLGRSSKMLEAFEYAQLGEAGGLVNLTDEAPEGITIDDTRERLRQRQRVLESCIAEVEARRAESNSQKTPQKVAGPKIADFMARSVMSISQDATLKEAAKKFRDLKIGSLLVQSGDDFIGSITETELTREVVANGVDPATTTVKTCMREPIITLESSDTIVEAVRAMKEKATRHVAVTESHKIVGLISVSDILRYYSGVS
ncbi:MAG: CBS domain-containing protein [Nitrospirota bacterium]|nr:CBS domain-containing protein [Nitrospirota bacterium]